ncbi:hypothetical protein BGZ80_001883 [Entomortierella chlamydospora]|uniref:Uncharacterized protein n=1 Tax=Entomortierella chlamydospora TaxID=101097 RepID=A0A9P6MR33_9FUNG|nr:hypothetical protein BGZ79_001192 [Entomortierella chlamydospora]KAG0009990.1 hypothetical protein BGZ80_001883 [Entomortierella chlamydospora]
MSAIPFWKHPDHRIPTLGLYRALLKASLALPKTCQDQPGRQRRPIPIKGAGPPGSNEPLPAIKRGYIFALIRDSFRANRYSTSPRITRGYLLEGEEALEKLEKARDGDRAIRRELRDMVNGRTGRLKEVIDHLNDLINFEPGETTQRSRYQRLKRAHEQVWDVRTQSSILRDPYSYYRITLKPSLFTFPPELDYYPPAKYPNQMKNQRGKFKNSGGVFLTEVTTSEGSRFPRIRGGTQPEWISMMLKSRVKKSVKRVNEWKDLEEKKAMMEVEEKFAASLGVKDSGYVEYLDTRLQSLKNLHWRKKFDTNSRNGVEALDDIST